MYIFYKAESFTPVTLRYTPERIIQIFTTQPLDCTMPSINAVVLNCFNIMPLGNRDPKSICVAGSKNSKEAPVLSDQLREPLGQCVLAGKTVGPPLAGVNNTLVS